jgi:hypothetical protein
MDEQHRRINFDLCTALDVTKLGVVLDRMIVAGLPSLTASEYRTMALALLTLLRCENDRLRAPSPSRDEGTDTKGAKP